MQYTLCKRFSGHGICQLRLKNRRAQKLPTLLL